MKSTTALGQPLKFDEPVQQRLPPCSVGVPSAAIRRDPGVEARLAQIGGQHTRHRRVVLHDQHSCHDVPSVRPGAFVGWSMPALHAISKGFVMSGISGRGRGWAGEELRRRSVPSAHRDRHARTQLWSAVSDPRVANERG